MVYEITGAGKVEKIRFDDVRTHRMSFVDEPTQLPWRKEVNGTKSDYISLSAILIDDDNTTDETTCKVTVDGKEVATDTQTGGVVECRVG